MSPKSLILMFFILYSATALMALPTTGETGFMEKAKGMTDKVGSDKLIEFVKDGSNNLQGQVQKLENKKKKYAYIIHSSEFCCTFNAQYINCHAPYKKINE
ncbi:uncharacterized protein LOC120355905 [Nilaparvata lugens]|uniref:uncharacterized protein LOC120355905 n=1 Tax=Nilaparvata lugens TaxID=108931 RepID=UPI00193D5DE1|nr:uncharacterized protein LOC120355905 [Nilaparvata lugens]